MKILLISSYEEVINLVKSMAENSEYVFDIVDSTTQLEYTLQGVFKGNIFAPLFSSDYDLILLDFDFLDVLQELNNRYCKDKLIYYPILMIVHGYENLDIAKILDTNISSIISLPVTEDQLSTHITLTLNHFRYISDIKRSAYLDSLTNLYNRRALMENLTRFFDIYCETKTPCCFAIIDLDHFKFINDTFGHLKGDYLLTILASIIQSCTRKTDVLARMGGEEFAIIFPNTSLDEAYQVLERIRVSVMESDQIEDILKVTLSAGVTKIRSFHKSPDDVIADADLLLYQAKDTGRNKVCK
ncbi:MAG: GGDEF domain-containing protein [Brevinemataceae bacterium]